MSSTSTILPNSAVQSSTTSSTTTGATGFNSLKPTDFINMMVTELKNQDPLQPASSQDLLAQMSQIGQLQSSNQLQTTLTGLAAQNQIGAASSLIGKQVLGTDDNSKTVTGTVTSVSITQSAAGTGASSVTLNLDSGDTLPLSNVQAIAPVATAQQAAAQAASQAAATQAATVQSAAAQASSAQGGLVQNLLSAVGL